MGWLYRSIKICVLIKLCVNGHVDSDVTKLRFGGDLRLKEVQRLFNSSKPVRLRVAQVHNFFCCNISNLKKCYKESTKNLLNIIIGT